MFNNIAFMMPKILFISTAVPPHPESQTIRNVFLLKGLRDEGCGITIITAECENEDRSLSFHMPSCYVFRTPKPRYFVIKERLGKMPLGSLWQWYYGIHANFFKIPDSWAGWEKVVVERALKDVNSDEVDIIITSSGSYTAHLAGAQLTKMWKKPWIVEMGDPWAINPIWPASFIYKYLRNQRLEKTTIPYASTLVVTTKETADCYKQWLGNKAPPIFIIPMGYDPAEFRDIAQIQRGPVIKIAYIGVAYRTGRDMRPTIDAVAKVGHRYPIIFKMIGPCSHSYLSYANKKAPNKIIFLGRVSYKESLEYIKNEEILVAIGNPGGMQVPGKLYMYLASGRPILYIAQSRVEDDPSWKLLKEFPGVFRCRNDKEEISATLYHILDNFEDISKISFSRASMPELSEYSWPSLGKKYFNLINQIVVTSYERK